MSNNSSNSHITSALEWIKESGLLAVTVVGLLIYFFLSIPATLFYSRLGTSPGEVGLNYANLLSGSTFELLIIFIMLASAVLSGGFFLAYFSMLVYTLVSVPEMVLMFRAPRQDRLDRVLESNLRLYKRAPEFFQGRKMFRPAFPKSVSEYETILNRRKELLRIQDPTPEQSAELEGIRLQLSRPRGLGAILRDAYVEPFIVIYLGIRHRIRRLAAPFTLAIVVIALPALAFIQAGQVLGGHTYFANNVGIFDYHADPVNVFPALPNTAPGILDLQTKKLFLLGQNAQYAVLYSPDDHSTIRVPITAVIISSVRG